MDVPAPHPGPGRRRGRPPPRCQGSGNALSDAERQEKASTRRGQQEARTLALIAAMDAMLSPADRARLDAMPRFAEILRTARALGALLGGALLGTARPGTAAVERVHP